MYVDFVLIRNGKMSEKAKEFQKNICFCFVDYAKAFDCVYIFFWKGSEVVVRGIY